MKQGELFPEGGVAPEPKPERKETAGPGATQKKAQPKVATKTRESAPGKKALPTSEEPPAPVPSAAKASATSAAPGDAADRRRAVTTFDRPVLLEAGAGTGKTATLVARVLQWCLGAGWEQEARARSGAENDELALGVLRGMAAITFTEAAAAEMSTRVGHALAAIQRATASGSLDTSALPLGLVLEELPQEAELLHARAVSLRGSLDRLDVSTIHAFCRRLLAAYPLEAGFDPAFEVDASFTRLEITVRDVLERYLRRVWSGKGDPDLVVLARAGFGPPELEADLIGLVEEGARATDFADDPFDDATCQGLLDRLGAALAGFESVADAMAGLGGNAGLALDAFRKTLETLASVDGGRAGLEAASAGLDEAWRVDERGWRRLKDWARGKLNKGELAAVGGGERAFVAAAEALTSVLRPFFELDLERLESARRLLHRLLGEVEEELRRRGVATFADLLFEAGRLLRENPAIAARERERLKQLLVDEFQDTDGVQCDLVSALGLEGEAGERPALFLVGDPKQSIFAWRNADLEAYDAFAERLEGEGGVRLALTHNFRSTAAILDEVERAVQPVMEEARGVQPPFVRLEPGRSDARASRGLGVEYWVSWPRDPESGELLFKNQHGPSYAVEARALAGDILERKSRGELAWKDCALVFRALTDVEPYLRELRERGVPYEVQSDRNYYRRREVVDATALVRAVVDPHDNLALVTLLRSPMVGVPDAAFLPLWREGFPGKLSHVFSPRAEALEELEAIARRVAQRLHAEAGASIPGLDAIAGWEESLVAALRHLAEARRSFRDDPADRWIENLRERFGPDRVEAARFLGAYRLANLERFFRDLLRAVEERSGDVLSILRTLRANLAREDRTEASRPADSGRDAVQVLTIHGAKGLEFGHVYLAQTHKPPRPGGDDRTVFDRRGEKVAYRLFGAPSAAWFDVAPARALAESAERVRLFYVALTRARERLVVLGGPDPACQGKGWRRAQTFAELIEERPETAAALRALTQLAADKAGEPYIDPAGVEWRLAEPIAHAVVPTPVREEGPEESSDSRSPAAGSEDLPALRARATERAARPLGQAASDKAHAEEREARAESRFDGGDPATRPALSRRTAQLVGTLVHRALEELDLEASDPAQALESRLHALEEALLADVPEKEREPAAERARDLVQRVAQNGLLDHLVQNREAILARELPVLLPAEESEEGALAYLSGSIDLLLRDPDDRLVVVDYKTDPVEGAELESRAEGYREQGRVYQRALREALALEEEPAFELWFLHSGQRLRT